ncbi:ATP-binding cassette domain-containing protein [Paraburkholderia tropica]|uniref:ATP-binding cassette, subfamily B n=3 Tax=Burkholderiaceae TaxID=119060 RepID=A0AAQ1JY06_9BURK|nr:ATP-binding cassette domain-containing protein [Paraburkholderia tropica]RQN36271.1 ABC transporter ATP-binding protein [Paraburkholderia tropica]SEK13977.1 ATP-binding cassette, subfamily B [Paraburkholderia tropica]
MHKPSPTRRAVRMLILRTLGEVLWRHRTATAAAASLMILARLSAVSVPIALKHLIDGLGHAHTLAMVPVLLALAYALLRFMSDALGEARDVAFSVVVQRAVATLRERTFAQLHRLGARFHAQRETGAIVRDVQKGADGLGFLLGTALFSVLPTLFEMGLVVAIVASHYDDAFVLAIVATFACYAVYTAIFTRRRLVFQRAVNALEAQADGRLVDSLLNHDTVKYFSTDRHEVARLRAVLDEWVLARTANQRALTTLHVGQSAVVAGGIAAVMLIAVQSVLSGAMTIGDLILVNAYIIQVCAPLNTLGFVFRETNDALTDVERLFGILAARGTPGEDEDVPGARALVLHEGEVAFRHVEFGYDAARAVLHDIDFVAAPGQTVAVVGGSGSGKSTLIRLLFRFYQPKQGTIAIDGQDIAHLRQATLREAIGIVPQDTVLFNDTIAYNIAYGQPAATRAEVVRAARAAQLDDLIERLPDHYDTRVGERGVRLSGGERQRIAIARAILRNPRIMVFDEATSALDTRSERAIQRELKGLARGRTTLVIAHRLSTIVDADLILVMEHGRIVERGRHDALIARDGVYAKMWAMQWRQDDLQHAERQLVNTPVEVAALLARVVAHVREAEGAEAVASVETQSEPGLWVSSADPDALAQAVMSLVTNELAHAPSRARASAPAVRLRTRREGNRVALSVAGGERPAPLDDDGLARIEALLGKAAASLALDPEGSCVCYAVSLPLHVLLPETGEGTLKDARELASLRVAVLDDEEETRNALEAVLSLHGASVEAQASGAQWLAALRATPRERWPDVLLCDLQLEDGEDGARVVAGLRDLEREMRAQSDPPARPLAVIALTGQTARLEQAPGEQGLFIARLAKPVAVPALLRAIGSATGREVTRRQAGESFTGR